MSGQIYSGGCLMYNIGVNFYDEFKRISTLPVSIENDGKCAALAEVWQGKLKDKQNGVVMVLGSGMGGGVVMNGKVHKGKDLFAGEFSFMMNDISSDSMSFENCYGLKLSTTGLIMCVASEMMQDFQTLDGEKVFRLINEGNTLAIKGLQIWCRRLALCIYNFNCFFNPDIFLIGGGISQQPILLETIKDELAKALATFPIPLPPIEIDTCAFFNESNMLGALYNFKCLHEVNND